MSVSVAEDGVIRLVGACPIEDAEALLRHLSSAPAAAVDWRACEQAHSAVIQVLLAAAPRMIGPPQTPFLAKHISPFLGAR
jgi:hypothetical protein